MPPTTMNFNKPINSMEDFEFPKLYALRWCQMLFATISLALSIAAMVGETATLGRYFAAHAYWVFMSCWTIVVPIIFMLIHAPNMGIVLLEIVTHAMWFCAFVAMCSKSGQIGGNCFITLSSTIDGTTIKTFTLSQPSPNFCKLAVAGCVFSGMMWFSFIFTTWNVLTYRVIQLSEKRRLQMMQNPPPMEENPPPPPVYIPNQMVTPMQKQHLPMPPTPYQQYMPPKLPASSRQAQYQFSTVGS